MNDIFNGISFGIGTGFCIGIVTFLVCSGLRSCLNFFEIGAE